MRKILSERSLVVVLFVSALTIFVFAQQDARKVEKIYMNSSITVVPSTPPQSATIEVKAPAQKPVIVSAE
jgi:general stress protein 26